MKKEREIAAGQAVEKIISRLAEEVGAKMDIENLALVGIRRRGVELAARLQNILQKKTAEIPLGILDITLYRDDLSAVAKQPVVRETQIQFDLDGKDILLVDDVLFTGRTIRAALSELVDFGRPRSIKLLVLVDRGHRELPIQPDFTGKFIPTEKNQSIEVRLEEVDGEDKILLIES
ncbi:MAG: bifunctional pyr operon transcriptional regulator/uracil phosphoribosyltransferase PyrR [Candidatus Omnitrophota bacterium]|nr:bifunctional pyr operon transcriptional regulator/uracil phosphoribosyltransferase PyrR [Candidatus Omnitrophota bacterium]